MLTDDGCNYYSLNAAACGAPQILIDLPACQNLMGAYALAGTVSHNNLLSWTLQYTGGSEHSWIPIAYGTSSVYNDILGLWDTALLEPCAYTLRLTAVGNCQGIPIESEYLQSFDVGIPADLDRDRDVDLEDLAVFSFWWLSVF